MGTKERPRRRHPAIQEGEVATAEGAARGESQNARHRRGHQGRKRKQPRTGPSRARNSNRSTGPPRLEHPRGSGPTTWTGTPGDEASGPGSERRGLHEVVEQAVAARTRPPGKKDQQERTNKREAHQGKQVQDQGPGQRLSVGKEIKAKT